MLEVIFFIVPVCLCILVGIDSYTKHKERMMDKELAFKRTAVSDDVKKQIEELTRKVESLASRMSFK